VWCLVVWFSSCRYGVELGGYVSGLRAAAAAPDDGHSGARNMLSKQ
jgi:hypothetical protein